MMYHRPKLGSSVIVLLLAFVFLTGLALASTTWAAPNGLQQSGVTPQPSPTIVTGCPPDCEPPQHCTVSSTDPTSCVNGSKTISVPVGAVPPGTIITINELGTQPPCPPTPDGQIWLDHCFKVTFTGPDGKPLTSFAKPVLDCMKYSASDLPPAGGNPNNLEIGFIFGNDSNPWTMVKPTVDAANSTVCASPDQPFYFQSLFTPKPTLPVTGATAGPSLWLLLALGLGIVALALIWRTGQSARN